MLFQIVSRCCYVTRLGVEIYISTMKSASHPRRLCQIHLSAWKVEPFSDRRSNLSPSRDSNIQCELWQSRLRIQSFNSRNPGEHTRRERQNDTLKTRTRIDEWTELLELSFFHRGFSQCVKRTVAALAIREQFLTVAEWSEVFKASQFVNKKT